jgi:hypothetical protein
MEQLRLAARHEVARRAARDAAAAAKAVAEEASGVAGRPES